MKMQDLFAALTATFRSLNPPLNPRFRPPANPEEIDAAEAAVGMVFPPQLRELLMCADGQDSPPYPPDPYSDPMFPSIEFRQGELGSTPSVWLASAAETAELTRSVRMEYEDLKEDGPFEVIGPASYHDQMLCFTKTEDASSLCLDFRPEAGGTFGQVVMVSTQPFQVVVLAPDLRSFLAEIVEGFKRGRFHPVPNAYYCRWSDQGAAAERHESVGTGLRVGEGRLMPAGLDAIDWASIRHSQGMASNLPELLRSLMSDDPKARSDAIAGLHETIWHQGTVSPAAAAAAVPFLYDLLDSPGVRDKGGIVSLLGRMATDEGVLRGRVRRDGETVWPSRLALQGRSLDEALAEEGAAMEALRFAVSAGLPHLLPYLSDSEHSPLVAEILGNHPEHRAWALPAVEAALASEPDEDTRQALARCRARLTEG